MLRLLSATPKSHKLENTTASLHFDFGFGYFHKIRTAGKWDHLPPNTLITKALKQLHNFEVKQDLESKD